MIGRQKEINKQTECTLAHTHTSLTATPRNSKLDLHYPHHPMLTRQRSPVDIFMFALHIMGRFAVVVMIVPSIPAVVTVVLSSSSVTMKLAI